MNAFPSTLKMEDHRPQLPKKTQDLFERAVQVIPGGIYGHNSPANTIPGIAPYFAKRAEGCRYWDVDGREYIDFLCSYGPIVLGHNNKEVNAAADEQRNAGDCFNHPSERFVELAEYLVGAVDFADWAIFGKNGSDMVNWAIKIAREYTGRKKVLYIDGAYHGSGYWCPTRGPSGSIPEDNVHSHTFLWNDIHSVHKLVNQHKGQIAAIITTPYHHPGGADSVLPAEGFLQEIENVCKNKGIVFILDDIRAGFRLHHGGSHQAFNFTPDISCFCKAIANGYPLSAAVGRDEFKQAASKVFMTGSYWFSAMPMAAALTCLHILKRDNVVEHLQAMGKRLTRGLENAAAKYGLRVTCSGPSALPYMSFAEETNLMRMQAFCSYCMENGVFFHPQHNWFINAAHQESDIDEAINIADNAFKKVANKVPA